MELDNLLRQVRDALGEPALELSTPWVPFTGGDREIRVLRRPPLGRGQFGLVFAVIIRIAPGLYMPAAMKMAALLDDHVTETLNGLAVNELLDAGVSPGLCYTLDAFAHSTLKPGSARTPQDWDGCVWRYIDEFIFSVRDEVARHYGPHAILEAKVLDPRQPKKGTARVSGGYTFGFIFTELVLVEPGYAPSTAQDILASLYVQFDAIRGLSAVGLHHCDISYRNCLQGRQLVQRRQGLQCLLRSEASNALRRSLYGLNMLCFGVDNDLPLAFVHVSNSFEQAREGPAYMASYTSVPIERTPVLIDYGKMQRAEIPAGQEIEYVRREIARRLQVANASEVPRYVLSAGSSLAYDYMGAYRGRPEAPGSALPAISFLTYPTATETSRPPEQLNPFVLASSAVAQKFLVMHTELSDVFSIAIVGIHQILRFGPFEACYLVSDKEDGRMRSGLSALPVELGPQRKPVLKLGKFHPLCSYLPPQACAEMPPTPSGARWAALVNETLCARLDAFVRRTMSLPQFAQASCPWLGFTRRNSELALSEPSEPGMLKGVTFTLAQRIQALGVPSARDVEGTFFAEFFRELRQEGHDEQSGWLRVALEHTLRGKYQLSSPHVGDLVDDLMACLHWDPAKRPPARRVLRNPAFRLLDQPLLEGNFQRAWSSEVPTAVVWPSRLRNDGSGKLALFEASEVAPSTFETKAPDGALYLPSERCKMGCRPVASVLELLRRHGRLPGVLLKEHRNQLPVHPKDSQNVATYNFNTGLLDYYDGKPYTNFATRQPSSVTRPGLCAAFKHDTTLECYLETLMNIEESLIPDWLLPPAEGTTPSSCTTVTPTEEEEGEEPLTKRPRL